MKNIKLLLISILPIVFTSCVDWDYFGLSNQSEIQGFELEMQSGTTVIDSVNRIIVVPVNERADRSNLSPTSITTSSLSTVNPGVGEPQDFRDTVLYTVTAENGDSSVWKVHADLQADVIPNSSFDEWYQVNSYFQPSPGDATNGSQYWDTPNKAATIVSSATFLVSPDSTDDRGVYAKMETKMVGLGALKLLSAGSIFSGKFTDDFPDANHPRSNINFGRPFGSKPSSFTVDYTYVPGTDYREGDVEGPGYDITDIYVVLQVRQDDGTRQRLGTAWFRSGDEVADWTSLEMDFIYGEIPAETLAEKPYMGLNTWPGEEEDSWADPSEFPTHIIIVFSSSALGDSFTGAVGSVLTIDNFDLQYDN